MLIAAASIVRKLTIDSYPGEEIDGVVSVVESSSWILHQLSTNHAFVEP
jgi:hypothetical protein